MEFCRNQAGVGTDGNEKQGKANMPDIRGVFPFAFLNFLVL